MSWEEYRDAHGLTCDYYSMLTTVPGDVSRLCPDCVVCNVCRRHTGSRTGEHDCSWGKAAA